MKKKFNMSDADIQSELQEIGTYAHFKDFLEGKLISSDNEEQIINRLGIENE